MGVDLRGFHIGMAEQLLHRENVLAALSKCVLRPDHTLQPRQLYLQHLLVQKQNRRQRLVLRGRRNITAHRQITEKGLHFRRAHILWMSVLMKTNEAPDPLQIDSFGTNRIVSQSNLPSHLVEQPRLVINVAVAP